ncbi:hotdog fold thioesterase [Oceanobacillus senegalensis]|uniref:hotdog fold thioesterase n=1 Tax=Oceanobacillus senegalensis TaxID=1936063 RepID=UPI000A30585B|nr:hotdog fold thioesterase [Oceanobacillus senegalensis]
MIKINDEVTIHQDHHKEILHKLKKDRYAEFLGIEIVDFSAGGATVQLKIEDHMLNAHATVHGGVLYTLADFAFALACNSYGKTSVGLSTTTHFMKSAEVGDIITARAMEVKRNHRTGFYRIVVESENEVIASIEAIAYRKSQYFISID